MAISEKYLKNTTTKSLNYGQIQLKLSDTLGNLFDGGDVDLSFLISNGNEYELMNTGGKQEKSNTHGNPFTSSFYNWSYYDDDQTPITYLGFCLIYAENYEQYTYDAFDLTNLVTNSIPWTKDEGWDKFKNARIILDVNNNGLNGVFIRPVIRRSQYGIANPNGSPIYYTGDGESNDVWDIFTVDVNITNYHKFMLDNEELSVFQSSGGQVLPCFFYNIDGNIFATKHPLYATYNDNWEYEIDGVKYSYTFAKITNNTNPSLDLNACGRGGFMYYSNPFYYARFALTYKPLQAFYIVNSSGLRWSKYETTITNAKQFRDNVRLGKMNGNGIVTYNEWIVGETGIQASDNPNKDMTYDKIPERKGGGGGGGDDNELDKQDHGLTGQGKQFATYYVMEQATFNSFVSELHGDSIEDIFRPMDFIISLMEAPSLLLSHTVVSSATPIKLGDYTTSVNANPVNYTWGDINLGSIQVDRKNNNFLDYEPYTKLVLYVPFCGFTELPTDVVMGKQIVLWGSFDIETGDLRVNVFCGDACITTMNGNASKFIPLTKDNAMLKFTNACLSAVSDVGSAVVGGAITGGVGAVSGAANALVNEAFNMQRNIVDYRKGNGTINAFYSPTKPCLYYYTPFVLNTDGYAKSTGFACNEYGTLSSFKGFTVCKNPHVEIQCTDNERNMIAELLESGVILPDSVDNNT